MTSVFVYEYLSGGGALAGQAEPLGDALSDAEAEMLAQGRAMRDALAADLAAIDTVEASVAASADVPADASLGDRLRWVSPAAHQDAEDFVRQQAARHDVVLLVAPESGGLLAQLAALVPPHAWAGCRLDAIDCAASKSATSVALRRAGIEVPRVWVPGMPADAHARAWVVKPDDGAGCTDTTWHTAFEAACAEYVHRSAAGEAVVMESWVEGPALSLSLLAGGGDVELLAVNRQHIAVHDGRVHYHGVSGAVQPVGDARGRMLAALAARVAEAVPGLAGYVGIDLVWHPERGPVVIEVNPRLTSAYVGLSGRLGRNLAGEMVAAHLAHAAGSAPGREAGA